MVDLVKQAISAIPGVSFVEDNALMHTLDVPNDPQFGSQYGPSMMASGRVGISRLRSSSITVALVDSGILKTHQEFANSGRILQGHDYVNNDADRMTRAGMARTRRARSARPRTTVWASPA